MEAEPEFSIASPDGASRKGRESASSTTALSSTTGELFRIWLANCTATSSSSTKQRISKDVASIQLEARNLFLSLVAGTTVRLGETETVLQTRASHGDALALLIQTLAPCFSATATLTARWAALSCLVGSIEGCRDAVVALPLVRLVGAFLLQHAGPLVDSNNNNNSEAGAVEDEDYAEQIRDTAVTGIASLLRTTTPPTSADHVSSPGDADDSVAWLKFRLSIAKSGVERRCAQEDTDDNANRGDEDYSRPPTSAAGLSLLPRSRRSLCFDLIRDAVDAVAAATDVRRHSPLSPDRVDAATLAESKGFCKFVAACLHGESDPRCLLQLLQLFDAVLAAFHPLGSNFPISEFFDAAAPYYPIQFNPPPHDLHGITRASLRHAVLRVLSCTYYDQNRHDEDNMLSLSCGLILESLVPPPDDGPPTFKEQFEALEDLRVFLLTKHGVTAETNCDKLDVGEIKSVSDAFMMVHESSSLAVSRGEDAVQAKALADLCRSVVAEVAMATERMRNRKGWQAFVKNPVMQLATRLDSTSSGRVAVAYMACLASSGGAKTLRICLDRGLVPLLKRLDDDASDDDAANAAYGIGAFFSSCRTAVERAGREGVHLHPHPLLPHSNNAVGRIYRILAPETLEAKRPSAQVAAVRALESILLASPKDVFADEQLDQIVKVFHLLSRRLLITRNSRPEVIEDRMESELLTAISMTFGTFLAASVSDIAPDADDKPQFVFDSSEQLRGFLQEDFFPALLGSAKIHFKTAPAAPRRDHDTLAIAASFSLEAASRVVRPLAEALHESLRAEQYDTALAVAQTFSHLFWQPDQLAARAYQELSSPAVSSLDILAVLVPDAGKMEGMEADFGMSSLRLPQTPEDREQDIIVLERAYGIIDLLRKGCEVGVTSDHFEKLVMSVEQVLPPLSDADTIKLSIALPFLSGAMEGSHPATNYVAHGGLITIDVLRGMIGDLADFAMTSEHFPGARSHAARCLHATISIFTPRNAQECPARDVTKENVIPSLKSSIDAARKIKHHLKEREAVVTSFLDSLSVLALLGSAAACRGGQSSKSSDQIVLCLVDLACIMKSTMPFTHEDEHIDLSVFDTQDHEQSTRMSVVAASGLASILATKCGNVLWKQRLTQLSIQRILGYVSRPAQSGSSVFNSQGSLGLLAALCHVICVSNLRNMSATNLEAVVEVIADGLSTAYLKAAMLADASVPELALAALVKLLCVSPASFRNIYPFVTGTLRAYATAGSLEQKSEVACKLLALQALEAISQIGTSPDGLKAVRPAVVSLLGTATNHPSSMLRLAAVEVRNAWLVVQ